MLKQVIKDTVRMPLKPWQAWGTDHLSKKPVPVFDHPLWKETFPNIKSESSSMQAGAIPMNPVAGYQAEETGTFLSTCSPQEAVESKEVTPLPHLLHTAQNVRTQGLL